MPGHVTVGLEPWPSLAREAELLGGAHFREVNEGITPERPYKLDTGLMRKMDELGMLKIVSARCAGALIGYFSWTINFDPESFGLLEAKQGAWYLAPGYPGVALEMWHRSLIELRALGVKLLWPHHHLQGRGAKLGKFFTRQGAVPVKQEYALWLA